MSDVSIKREERLIDVLSKSFIVGNVFMPNTDFKVRFYGDGFTRLVLNPAKNKEIKVNSYLREISTLSPNYLLDNVNIDDYQPIEEGAFLSVLYLYTVKNVCIGHPLSYKGAPAVFYVKLDSGSTVFIFIRQAHQAQWNLCVFPDFDFDLFRNCYLCNFIY